MVPPNLEHVVRAIVQPSVAEPAWRFGDRILPPEETVRLMRPVARSFGVTRLADVTGLDRIGLPVWMAVRPNSKSIAVNQGKGATTAAAQASALMEAIELSVAERDDLPTVLASPGELKRSGTHFDPCIDLLRRGQKVPGDDERIEWIQGYDLLADVATLVPYEATTIDHTAVGGRYWRSTDGLASGNCLEEAILHGICERVERDASAIFNIDAARKRANSCVDPDLLRDEELSRVIELIERADLQIKVFDITSDIGIPVFFATLSPRPDGTEKNWRQFELVSGSGCHALPGRAATRAVTEAVQSRLTKISGARDDFDPASYAATMDAGLLSYLDAKPSVEAASRLQAICARHFSSMQSILDALSTRGIGSVIVVPLAAERDFAVVKVLISGLEHPPGDRHQRYGRRMLASLWSGI